MRFRTKMVAGNLVNLKTTREAEAGPARSPKRVTCDPGSGPQGPGDKKNKKKTTREIEWTGFDDWLNNRARTEWKAMDHALILAEEMVIMNTFIEMGNTGEKADLG